MMDGTTEAKGMPIGMLNANLDDEQVMRVGIPHRGGRLAFHAFEQGYKVMVSSQAFWDSKNGCFKMPQATDLAEMDLALDSAGYTAMELWKRKGRQPGMAGVFPWTYSEYLAFVSMVPRSWYSAPDMCVEPEIAASKDELDFRIRGTATLLEGTMQTLYAWHNQMVREGWSETAIQNLLPPPVAVIQGWTVENYQSSLELTMQVWERWQPWVAAPALIGIGSVCRRSLKDPKHGLHAIVDGLEGMIPKTTRAHLFGVKGTVLNALKMREWVASFDSMAYDFSARIDARTKKISNSIQHRSEAMCSWMNKAATRMAPAPGDQFRLPLH